MIGGILRISQAMASNGQADTVVEEISGLEEAVLQALVEAAEYHDGSGDLAVPAADEALDRIATERTLEAAVGRFQRSDLTFEIDLSEAGRLVVYQRIPDQALADYVSQYRDLGRFITTVGLTGVTISVIALAADFERGWMIGEAGGALPDLLGAAGDGADVLDLAGAFDPTTLVASLGLSLVGRYMQREARQKLEEAVAFAERTVPNTHQKAVVAAHLRDRGDTYRALAEALEAHLDHTRCWPQQRSIEGLHWYRSALIADQQILGLAVHAINRLEITNSDGTYSEESRTAVAGGLALADSSQQSLRTLRRRLWGARGAAVVLVAALGAWGFATASPTDGSATAGSQSVPAANGPAVAEQDGTFEVESDAEDRDVETGGDMTPEPVNNAAEPAQADLDGAIAAAQSDSCPTCVMLTSTRAIAEESASRGLVELSVADPQGGGAVAVWGYSGKAWRPLASYQNDIPLPALLPSRIWICTDSNSTNARSGPGTRFPVVGNVKDDQQVDARRAVLTKRATVSRKGYPTSGVAWIKVTSETIIGWVISDRVSNEHGCALWRQFEASS